MWAEVFAAVNAVAQKEAKERGYSQYRIDKKTLETFKASIHRRPIKDENTRSQYYTHSVFYSNNTNEDYVWPENREVNSRRNSKETSECSANMEFKGEVPKLGKAKSEQSLGLKNESEANVHRRYEQGPIKIPGQCKVSFNSVHRTDTQRYELEALGSTSIVVNPGHPIAKHAAIGGAAGATTGGLAGAGVGGVIGGAIGIIAGPPGVILGATLGGTIGGLVGVGSGGGAIGGLGGVIGAARGVAKRYDIQFTITAEDVFRELDDFKKVGQKVFCQVTGTHGWDEDQREVSSN